MTVVRLNKPMLSLPEIPQRWAVLEMKNNGDQLEPTEYVRFYSTLEEAEIQAALVCEQSRFAAALILRADSIQTRIERRTLP